jgi:pyrroloquinoline-quinone synthase
VRTVDIEGRAAILAAIEEALEGRRLLTHRFYQRWSHGELRAGELAAYAGQYRFIEAGLPGWLRSIQNCADTPRLRDLLQRNLDDEVGGDVTHLELFDRFAAAVGAVNPGDSGVGVATVLAGIDAATSTAFVTPVATVATEIAQVRP